jgi:plastocyanin
MRGSSTGRLLVVLVLATAALWPAAIAAAGGGCHGRSTQGSGDTVAMTKACFTPSVLRVDPGTEVTFVNKDPITHNVSASEWGSNGDLYEGDRFAVTFDREGTFPYACMYHYGMTGAVVVGDGTGPASGDPIEVGSVVDSTPLAKDRAARVSSATPEDSGPVGWTVAAGGTGLVIGAALARMILRGRRSI